MEYFHFSEPEQQSNPDLEKKTSRAVSRVGLALFVFMLVSTAASLVLQLLTRFIQPELFEADWYTWTVTIFSLYVVAAPFAYLILRPLEKENLPKKRLSAKTFLIFLFIGFLLMIVGSIIGQNINRFIGLFAGEQESTITEAMRGSALWLSCLYSLIIAPVMEELFFRKFLVDRLSFLGDIACVILSGVAFGLFHGNIEQFFYAALLGGLLAYVYLKTGNLLYTILMHGIVNFFGGILPTIVDYLLPVNFFSGVTDAELPALIEAHPLSFLCMMAVAYLPYLFSVIGLVFLLIYWRRLKQGLTPCPLAPRTRARAILANPGAILYLVITLLSIVATIFLA